MTAIADAMNVVVILMTAKIDGVSLGVILKTAKADAMRVDVTLMERGKVIAKIQAALASERMMHDACVVRPIEVGHPQTL